MFSCQKSKIAFLIGNLWKAASAIYAYCFAFLFDNEHFLDRTTCLNYVNDMTSVVVDTKPQNWPIVMT